MFFQYTLIFATHYPNIRSTLAVLAVINKQSEFMIYKINCSQNDALQV